MDDLFTVEIWKPDSFDISGKWVYTLKSNVYNIARDHKEFMDEMGYRTRLTPELN